MNTTIPSVIAEYRDYSRAFNIIIVLDRMGKESSGAKRLVEKKTSQRRDTQSEDAQRELAMQWDPSKGVVSRAQIVENGGVVVTIRTTTNEKVVTCNGFSKRGNKYSQLVKILRRKGFIPTRARINSFLLDKGFVDIRADPSKECFLAGDRLILLLNGASHRLTKAYDKAGIQKRYFFNLAIPCSKKQIKKHN